MSDLFGLEPEPVVQPERRVASFRCHCGCMDEVREPAPEYVACWGKSGAGKPCRLRMFRWVPAYAVPFYSARPTTPAERDRISSP